MKRSAIKRGTKPWLRKSKLAPRSAKMKRVYQRRAPFVAAFLAENPQCAVCGQPSVDCHELIRRSHGGAIYPGQPNKRANVYFALCRRCHDYVTTHPMWARANGYETS